MSMTVCGRDCSDIHPAAPCPECGHWSGVHPGVHNPSLTNCLICEHLPNRYKRIRAAIGKLRRVAPKKLD